MDIRREGRKFETSVARNAGHASFSALRGKRSPTAATCSAAPASANMVAKGLSAYLGRRLKVPGLEFAQGPVELCGGWETYTYAFQLQAQPELPVAYANPLVARIYSCGKGLPRARHEFAVQRHMTRLGYPVPPCLLLEEKCDYFGGPFLISTRTAGQVLLHSLLHEPWRVTDLARRMASAHARLHQLPARGFPGACRSFLSKTLEEMTHVVRQYNLTSMWPGLDYLWTNRPPSPRRSSILHLDFHPLNLIDAAHDELVAIDWPEAAVGDRYADLGNTLLTLDCQTDDSLSWLDQLFLSTGRWLFVAAYLKAYAEQLPVEDDLLCYYRAWATFRRLCVYARWLRVGPTMYGRKPSGIKHLEAGHLRTLEAYFYKWAQVQIALE